MQRPEAMVYSGASMRPVSSWGRLGAEPHDVVELTDRTAVAAAVTGRSGIAYGLGRSYGDACLNPNGLLWRTAAMPATYVPGEDPAAVPYSFDMMHSGGTSFAVARFPPGFVAPIHATDTLDYLVVLSGELVLVLEEGEARAGPGDFIVDCGVKHGWRNDGAEEAVFVVVVTPAHPTGDGRTG